MLVYPRVLALNFLLLISVGDLQMLEFNPHAHDPDSPFPSLIYPTLHLPSYHLQQPSGPGCLDINPSTSMCSKLNLLLFIFLTIKLIISSFKSEILFLSLVLPSHSFSISNVSRISYFCLHNCLHLTFPLCGRCLYHHFTR